MHCSGGDLIEQQCSLGGTTVAMQDMSFLHHMGTPQDVLTSIVNSHTTAIFYL
jgi:hypothetical protein